MIAFYTSHCPKCKVLKQLMDNKKIKYLEIDDEDIYMQIADENKIMSMPFAYINGTIYTTQELQKYINDNKGE